MNAYECVCMWVEHLKPAFISFSIKDIVVFRYTTHRPNNNVSIKYFFSSLFTSSRFLMLMCTFHVSSQERPSALFIFLCFNSIFYRQLLFSCTPSLCSCTIQCVCVWVCQILKNDEHRPFLLLFLSCLYVTPPRGTNFFLSLFLSHSALHFSSVYTCKWTLWDGSFILM